jgi:hypothetical protein
VRIPVSRVLVARAALRARAAATGAAVLAAAADLAAGPSSFALTLAVLVLLAALLGAVLPRGLVPGAVLLLLVGEHLATTATLSAGARGAVAVPAAAALWLVHVLYGLAAAVPLDASVDPTVVRRFLVRLRDVLLVALPVGAAAALLARAVPLAPAVAVPAAAALLVLPLLVVAQADRNRRSTPSGTSSRTSA